MSEHYMIQQDLLSDPPFIAGIEIISAVLTLIYLLSTTSFLNMINLHSIRVSFLQLRKKTFLVPSFSLLILGWSLSSIFTISPTPYHWIALVLVLITMMYEIFLFGGVIKRIENPEFVTIAEIDKISGFTDRDEILGLSFNDESKAYPIRMLELPHLLNDTVGGLDVVITYCGLCNSSEIYKRDFKGKKREFYSADILFHSNMLFYDEEGNYYRQLNGKSIRGPDKGDTLDLVNSTISSFGVWKRMHPDTKVMNFRPRGRQYIADRTWFGKAAEISKSRVLYPAGKKSDQFSSHTRMMGVIVKGDALGIAVELFENGVDINTELNGVPIYLFRDETTGLFGAFERPDNLNITFRQADDTVVLITGSGSWRANGKALKSTFDLQPVKNMFPIYWFAWYGNYPDTVVISS